MAAVIGADVDQLRELAQRFTQSADKLQHSSSGLTKAIDNATYWRGNDANQFGVRWHSQSIPAIIAVISTLRAAAKALISNADEQDRASAASGGAGTAAKGAQTGSSNKPGTAAENMTGLWNRAHQATDTESGYVVEKITNKLGKTVYVVYIGGTTSSLTGDGQTKAGAIGSALNVADSKQIEQLKTIIHPKDAEVMLVGYSQGGMDAQNIAAKNTFNVTQVVTFGSPTRHDLEVPVVNMVAKGDPWVRAAKWGPYSPASDSNILNKIIPNNVANNDHYVYEHEVKGDPHTSYGQIAENYDKMVAADGPPIQGFNAQLFKGTVEEVYNLDS